VHMQSLAQQDDRQMGGPVSVLVRQKRDHVRLDELLHELGTAAPGDRQDEVLQRINRLVFPHAFAEEAVLWPVLRRVLPDGEELTIQVEKEHQEVNELVVSLEKTRGGPERQRLLDRLVEVLREDVRDEEDQLLPRLQDAVDGPTLRRLGIAWEALRRTAPTRPHPVVARRPPGNALAALPLSLIDRSRDALDGVARSRDGQWGRTASTVSGGLARLAGRVERLQPMRRGERPVTSRA
jgi:Hemerythrin HHE cation binding domain